MRGETARDALQAVTKEKKKKQTLYSATVPIKKSVYKCGARPEEMHYRV